MSSRLKGNIVKEYLEKFPKVQNLTLAKKIYKENIEVFNNIDSVRTLIRNYRGSLGELGKKNLADRRFLNQTPLPPTLPKSQKESKNPYQIPKVNNKILIISDIHAPFHDVEAIKAAMAYGKEKEINCIYINGDLVDFYGLSRFEKDPRKVNVPYEIKCAKEILAYIRASFPKALIVYYMGNHDHRFNKYLLLKAPELLDLPEFDYYTIMECQKNNIILLDNNRGATAGKLNIRHGHEFYGSGGVFPARSYYLKAKDNILVSHVHRTSEYTEPNINKAVFGGWSIGCLSDLDPDYSPNNSYNLGFAYVEILDRDGNFRVDNKRIIKGKIL